MYFVKAYACTTGTRLPLDFVITVGYGPCGFSKSGFSPFHKNVLSWPPITKSTSGHSLAIFLSISKPEWPRAIIISTPVALSLAVSRLFFNFFFLITFNYLNILKTYLMAGTSAIKLTSFGGVIDLVYGVR